MSKLSAFLNPVSLSEEKDVVISKRFIGEDGKPVPFHIRSLTQVENENISKKCSGYRKINGQQIEFFDNVKYSRELVLAAVVEPDLRDAELCKRYGVADPSFTASAMLLPGEFAELVKEIMDVSGFEDDDPQAKAKN